MPRKKLSSADLSAYNDRMYDDYAHQLSDRRNMAMMHSRRSNYAEARPFFDAEQKDRAVATVVDGVIGGATAYGLGYYQGKSNGMPELLHFGYDLWASLALWSVAILGENYLGERNSEYVAAAGHGAFAFWAGNLGSRMGCESRANAGDAPCGSPIKTDGTIENRYGPFLATPAKPTGSVGGWNYRDARVVR